MKFKLENLEKMEIFARRLSRLAKRGDVFSLIGDLGAGKTCLSQFVLKELGVQKYVTSPTFSLVNIYDIDDKSISKAYHLDLYRLENEEEIEQIDFENYFYPDGISLIEWAQMAKSYLPDDMIEIKISHLDQGRQIEIVENNQRARELVGGFDENFIS